MRQIAIEAAARLHGYLGAVTGRHRPRRRRRAHLLARRRYALYAAFDGNDVAKIIGLDTPLSRRCTGRLSERTDARYPAFIMSAWRRTSRRRNSTSRRARCRAALHRQRLSGLLSYARMIRQAGGNGNRLSPFQRLVHRSELLWSEGLGADVGPDAKVRENLGESQVEGGAVAAAEGGA